MKKSAKRPATLETTLDNSNVDTSALDALTVLGLDASEVATSATETTQETIVAKQDDNIDFGDIELGTITEVPTARRTGGGGGQGSRFPFDKLAAPAVGPDGKPALANFVVRYKAEFDASKFKRSIQSATTQANRNTDGKYFESRSVMTAGVLAGIMVIRTDNRPINDAVEAGE